MNRNAGFTLIELLVTVTVLAIVLAFGLPNLQELIQNNRLVTQINEFVTDLNLARSEAVKRGSSVTMCKRNTAGNNCDNGASWLAGWLVFADLNHDGDVDSGESILKIHGDMKGLTVINFSNNRVTFDSQGFSQGYNATITFCDSRGLGKAKGKVLSNTGRLRDAATGDTLTCS